MVLNRVISVDLTKMQKSGQRLRGEVSKIAKISVGRAFQKKKKRHYKDPEMGVYLVCSWDSKENSAAGRE